MFRFSFGWVTIWPTKLLDLQNAGLLVEKTVQEISSNQLFGLQEENSFLEDKLKKGNIQAEIEKRMRALTKEVLGDQKELTETQKTQIQVELSRNSHG